MIFSREQLAEEAAAYMRQRGQVGFAKVIDELRITLATIAASASQIPGSYTALTERLEAIEDTARKALS
jgi:hypothetical protein